MLKAFARQETMTVFPCYSLHHSDIVSMASQRCCAIQQYLHPKHPIRTIEIATCQRAANSILQNKIDLYQSRHEEGNWQHVFA
jgi:hypothetical protein